MDPFGGDRNGKNTMNSKGFGAFPARKGGRFWTPVFGECPLEFNRGIQRKSGNQEYFIPIMGWILEDRTIFLEKWKNGLSECMRGMRGSRPSGVQ